MKRGQSALEYLVTYGWAILAIVIIAGVLWYTGVFDPARFAGGKQASGFSPFIAQDFKASSNGSLTIVLNNGAGAKATGVTLTGGTSASCYPSTVTASANTTCVIIAFTTSPGTSGDTLDRATVSGSFTDSRSGLNHSFSGTVQGKYE